MKMPIMIGMAMAMAMLMMQVMVKLGEGDGNDDSDNDSDNVKIATTRDNCLISHRPSTGKCRQLLSFDFQHFFYQLCRKGPINKARTSCLKR